MDAKTGERLAEVIAQALDPKCPEAVVSFGGGETFLQFDRFIRLADLIRARCRARGGQVRLVVTTNGVLLDEGRLRKLARRRIGLSFSLDGPETVHDAARRDASGRRTFLRAFRNWSRYRRMIQALPEAPPCRINGVFGEHSGSLPDLARFWLANGVPLQEIVAVNPSRFNKTGRRQGTERAQARFVTGLREWGLEQVARCTPGNFLGEYRGPGVLFKGWQRLFAEQEKGFCTPGRGMLAVGPDGALYPCEAYIGLKRRRVGDVFGGLDSGRMKAFVAGCAKAEAICEGCSRRMACEKPCLAIRADLSPARNVARVCLFARKVADVTQETFDMLMRKDAGGGQ
jgi:uncharacterized protein